MSIWCFLKVVSSKTGQAWRQTAIDGWDSSAGRLTGSKVVKVSNRSLDQELGWCESQRPLLQCLITPRKMVQICSSTLNMGAKFLEHSQKVMRQRTPTFSTSWEQGETLAEWVAKLFPNRSTVSDLMKSRAADQRQARERKKERTKERKKESKKESKKERKGGKKNRERKKVWFNVSIYADLASN